jgi:type IV secretion system protein VirB10
LIVTNDANDQFENRLEPDGGSDVNADRNAYRSLPGEPGIPNVATRSRMQVSKKGLLAVGLLIVSLVAVSAISINRFVGSGKKADDADSKRAGDRPSAATTEPRKLDVPVLQVSKAASSAVTPALRVPALVPTAEEIAEPIGVRRTGQTAPGAGGAKPMAPEDAPALLVSSRPGTAVAPKQSGPSAALVDASVAPDAETEASDPLASTTKNLQGYQRQLQGLMEQLTKTATAAASPSGGSAASGLSNAASRPPAFTTTSAAPSSNSSPVGGGLFGGALVGSATPRTAASLLINRSLTLPKGTAFTCALKTRVISATSGLVGCQVQRHVFSDDGRVLLIERGSHLDGEYRVAALRPGTVRIPVLWTRIRTPNGVSVDIESPGTGQLGESGIDGYVDNRWFERIGAAMLLSLIDDSVKLVIQDQANQSGGGGQANTFVLPSTTANASKLAEKVLDSTINIPPLIYQNQGGIVGIYVARDVDFSAVYELKPVARADLRTDPNGAPR